MGTSADTAFRLIAGSKKLLTRGQVGEAASRAKGAGTSLEAAVVELGFLSDEDLERILQTRERHVRECSSCGDVTYLLPKQTVQNTPCEHCQAPLAPTADDERPRRGQTGRAPAPKKPATKKPAPKEPATQKPERPTGRRIMSRAEREAQAPEAAPPTAAHLAAYEAAEASQSAMGEITFSAPTEEVLGAPVPEASAPPPEASAPDPLDAATPPASPASADDDDLSFRSVAFDPEEIAAARAEAAPDAPARDAPTPDAPAPDAPAPGAPAPGAREASPPEPARSSEPRRGPSRGGPAEQTQASLEDAAQAPSEASGVAPQSVIGSPVPSSRGSGLPGDDPLPASRARSLRHQGGGFAYEPPEELAPRAPRPRAFGEGMAAPSFGGSAPAPDADPGAETLDEPMGGAPDDDRFAPRAEHMAAHGRGEEDVYVPPLRQDIARILKLPLEKDGIGMLLLGTVMVTLIGVLPITPFTLLPVLVVMAYPITFLISCTRYGSLGRNSLPDWPDLNFGLLANLWHSLLVWFACLLPLALVAVPLVCVTLGLAAKAAKSNAGAAAPLYSIGTSAHSARRAEGDWYVKKGTDVSGTTFVEPGVENEVVIGGEWTVIGLLNRSNADDTGTTAAFTDMGAPGALGAAGVPGFQAHDLDRVGRALSGKVKVLAAYADPDERIVQSRFRWLRGDEPEEDFEDEELSEQETREAEVRKAFEKASAKATFNRRRGFDDGVHVSEPFAGLTVVKTVDWTFPGPFEGIKPLPVVYVIDDQGRVAKEYAAGVDDEQLYGDLKDLLAGGDGDSSGSTLPPHIKPPSSAVFGLLAGGSVILLLFAGLVGGLFFSFYWPAAQLIMVTFDSGTMAFNYPAAIRAIRAGFKDYLALVGIVFGLSMAGTVLAQVLNFGLIFLPGLLRVVLSSLFVAVFGFYSQIVGAYAIGRYYYANKEAIGWFGSSR